jgi:predicted O-methyltransferase YrrM
MIGRQAARWCLHACGLARAETQVTPAEAAALARHAAGRTRLVEIGVMQGASTRLLRDAMDARGTITGIDPHPPGRLGVNFDRSIARSEIRRSRNGQARLLRRTSADAAADWQTPIDFLFIDGDHSWTGIDADWRMWSRFIEVRGVVALHDSRAVDGRPTLDSERYTRQVILTDRRFRLIDEVETLTVLERRSEMA